ncbi:MAG: hypothetical protein PUA62_05650 [Lachnospiraceae bacterium]|nr:hypothetical protein [Lachnospiraceae bacterium]
MLLEQALGEFTEKLDNQNIRVIVQNNAANTSVCADGKLMWRVFENLIGNIVKYTQPGTRVYVEIREVLSENMQGKEGLSVILKNISKDARLRRVLWSCKTERWKLMWMVICLR